MIAVTTVTFIYDEVDAPFEDRFNMIAKLRTIEVKVSESIEIPEKALPVRLEPIMERSGLTVDTRSDRFLLYFLEIG